MQRLKSLEEAERKSQQDNTDSDNIFSIVATEADGVCNNCFERNYNIQDISSYNHSCLGDKVYHPIQENTDLDYLNGRLPSEPERVCKCGAVKSSTEMRPILREELILEYASNLCSRLEEWDVPYDSEKLYDSLFESYIVNNEVRNEDYIEAVKEATHISYRELKKRLEQEDEMFYSEDNIPNNVVDYDDYDSQEWSDRSSYMGRKSSTITTQSSMFFISFQEVV